MGKLMIFKENIIIITGNCRSDSFCYHMKKYGELSNTFIELCNENKNSTHIDRMIYIVQEI